MPKRTLSYDDALHEDLRDPNEAAAYLAASLDESNAADSEELFLMALKNVAIAHGMTDIASKSNLGRESLYKTLSASGNPKLTTLKTILASVGLRITVKPATTRRASRSLMIHTHGNVISCDATEWQTTSLSRQCMAAKPRVPSLPTRSNDTGWSSNWLTNETVQMAVNEGAGS